jgi:hypothetical protein
MKLYHGTTEAVARLALTDGLLPREEAEVETQWPDCPSRPDMVYLTNAYAPYFAGCATENVGDLLGIVEIDTEILFDDYVTENGLEDFLHPDEDFLEQATRSPESGPHLAPFDATMHERTAFYREHLESFQQHWRDSLEALGNVAAKGEVPSECVTRIALIDPKKAPHVLQIGMDPCITLMNYAICGHKYRSLTNWIFGAEITTADLMVFDHPEWPDELREGARYMAKILKSRDGVEIIDAVTV